VRGVVERFHRYESTDGEVTLGDTDAEVFVFSGEPDLIVLTARTNGALFTLSDRVTHEEHAITVLAGQSLEVRLPRQRVLGRNLVGAANASVSVCGFYVEPAEAWNRRQATRSTP
jgi:hypothetical protein